MKLQPFMRKRRNDTKIYATVFLMFIQRCCGISFYIAVVRLVEYLLSALVGEFRPSAATASSATSGRCASNNLRTQKERGRLVCPRSEFLYCRDFLGRMFGLLFMALLPRRFCALTERLCLSSSPQAFRERLEPKLFSLAFLPKFVCS